ncbi:MAG: FG-GAP-like repeat-containing protein, partial [Bryobacteraceae bacterium]
SSGKVVVISPRGEKLAGMEMDLTPAGTPVAGQGKIFAADAGGSIYAFDVSGKRLWKHERVERSGGGFNYPVLADVDGDGAAEVMMSGSRGTLYAVDTRGRLRLEVHDTNYRVTTPAGGDINGDGRTELVFGSEDNEIYALTGDGRLLWSRRIEGTRFGRALPLIADIDGDGRYEVLVSTPFVGPGPGLYALDGVTGRVRWKAPSRMQSYNSTVMADLNGDGRNEILFGDKNTSLYAVDSGGRLLWNRQLDGRGIFFAPAVADLNGDGQATVFQVVRASGANGKSLYALNGKGEVVDELALEGGGGSSPVLVRFKGESDLKLLVLSASGKLLCYRLPQRTGAARILWQGTRNDSSNTGFVRSAVAAQRVLTPPSKAGPGETHIGAREVTTDGTIRLRIIPAGMPEQPGFEPVRVRRGVPAAVWQIANPWPSFQEARLSAATGGSANRVEVAMLGNEYESAAIAVTNLRNDRATLRIECGAFVSDGKKTTPAKKVIEFREAPLVMAESTGRPVEDVLPMLGEGQLVWLGPNETRKIWLTFRSRDLDAGTHRATLKIGDLLSVDAPLSVTVEVKVHPVRLPEKRVYRHGNWLYLAGIQDPDLRDAVMKDALEHGTNVFNVPSCSVQVNERGVIGAASTEPHDTLVKALRGKAFFMVGGSVGLAWPKGFKPEAALERRAYADAIRWYGQHMKALGVGYREWAFYTMDEPGLMGRDASWERWVEGVKRIKSADANVQIYANPAGGARAELLSEASGLIDVWQPDLHLVREQPEALSRIFSRGQYWHYEAPADQRNLDPLGYYRMKPWVAFQMGMTGGGYWVYQSSSFWFFDRNLPVEYGTVYPTDKGPVTTKRWEASRDGAEDFELLWMVRESAKARRDELGRAALALVDEAVRFVTKGQEQVSDISRQVRPYTPDFRQWMEYRAGLIDMAVRLKSQSHK